MADYVDDSDKPLPPELAFYIDTRDFGDPWGQGWMYWPPEVFMTTKLVRNVYNAWTGYTRCDNRVRWMNDHPGGAEIVGLIKGYRYEEEAGPTAFERWEAAAGDALVRARLEHVSTVRMYGR